MSKRESLAHFKAVMLKIRDLRAWALAADIDPWSLRHGLIMVLEMDTAAALDRGIKAEDLAEFDLDVKNDVRRWIKQQRTQK